VKNEIAALIIAAFGVTGGTIIGYQAHLSQQPKPTPILDLPCELPARVVVHWLHLCLSEYDSDSWTSDEWTEGCIEVVKERLCKAAEGGKL